MRPDIHRLRGADVHERCPGCLNLVNHDACAMGCNIARCKQPGCGELYLTTEGCTCSAPCADCGDTCVPGEGCACLERYCGACFVFHCASCRDDMRDSLAHVSRGER